MMSGGEVQSHGCGHVQFHQNHTGVTGNHDHTLNLGSNHGHDHDERDVRYTWYDYANNRYGHGLPPAGADGWHLHCLITKVGGM